MVLVTLVTYFTNLAVAVLAGVALAALGFAWKSAARGVQVKRRAAGPALGTCPTSS